MPRYKVTRYKVTAYATYETEVEADSAEEAEEIAADECPFPYVDFCETEEIDDDQEGTHE